MRVEPTHKSDLVVQLEGPQTLLSVGVYDGCSLTLMQSWTLFVVEEAITDTEVLAKAMEFGLDAGAKIHTLEGVERHWKIESVKLRVEDVTGIPPEDQTLTYRGVLLSDGEKLPDHPDIHNRSELVLRDINAATRRKRGVNIRGPDAAKKMNADSVITMSRMFRYMPVVCELSELNRTLPALYARH